MDKMREEFEAWYSKELGFREDNAERMFSMFCDDGETHEYYRLGVRSAWKAWQASRAERHVNACAGMADPAAEIAELKRQRDELLGLVKAVSYHSIPVTVDGIKCAAFPWSEYESMVIKAKGGSS